MNRRYRLPRISEKEKDGCYAVLASSLGVEITPW